MHQRTRKRKNGTTWTAFYYRYRDATGKDVPLGKDLDKARLKWAELEAKDKAASEIVDIGDASLLLGHSKQEITKRVYRRIGATAKPSK